MSIKQDFDSLFRAYYEPLCNYARVILKDDVAGEDVVQSVFEALWSKGLNNIDHPKRYLIKAVKFGCFDAIRKRKRSTPLTDSEQYLNEMVDDSDDPQIDEELIQKLTFLVAELPEKTRIVFLLSRQSGYTYREIAEELEISIKTVENQMARALRHLRAGLSSFS